MSSSAWARQPFLSGTITATRSRLAVGAAAEDGE